MGTGVGSAVCIDGQLYRGQRRLVEIGHMPVQVQRQGQGQGQEQGGVPCACGQRDCLEVFCSGSGIAARFKSAVAVAAASPAAVGGDGATSATAKEVCAWSRDPTALHHTIAAAVLEEAASALACACISITRILDPVTIILTGPLAAVLIDSTSQYYSSMQWRLHDDTSSVALRLSTVSQPGVLGAACIALAHQQRQGEVLATGSIAGSEGPREGVRTTK